MISSDGFFIEDTFLMANLQQTSISGKTEWQVQALFENVSVSIQFSSRMCMMHATKATYFFQVC